MQKLAQDCAHNEPKAVGMVNEVLDAIGDHIDRLLHRAESHKAKELVQDYVRREPGAVKLIDNLLANAGVGIDTLMVEALAEELDYIEWIERLTTVAESRRNASLREIDRRRAALGETVRRSLQEIDEAEFKVIETTSDKGTNAA